jgi:hypothetical protein
MDIVSMNIAVDQVTCDGCGASTDLKIITATIYGFGGNPGPPDGADMLASQTTLPDGWSTTTVTGPNPSSQTLCAACSGAVRAAVSTAVANIAPVAVPSPSQPPVKVQ